MDIHGLIPSDDLINRCAPGKDEHHIADAWRPVISSELRENEKEAAQNVGEV
jgi:hypothetical protein